MRETFAALRPDLQAVADLTPAGAKVLDLGCGDGELLAYLVRHKQARGRGIELSEAGVMACVQRGLSVSRQRNRSECDRQRRYYQPGRKPIHHKERAVKGVEMIALATLTNCPL